MKRKCDSCIHSHCCEEHLHDVWNPFDNCRMYDAERPHGEWIGNRFGIQCSECGLIRNAVPYEMNFCPNCGAPMTEEAFRKYNGLKEGEAE